MDPNQPASSNPVPQPEPTPQSPAPAPMQIPEAPAASVPTAAQAPVGSVVSPAEPAPVASIQPNVQPNVESPLPAAPVPPALPTPPAVPMPQLPVSASQQMSSGISKKKFLIIALIIIAVFTIIGIVAGFNIVKSRNSGSKSSGGTSVDYSGIGRKEADVEDRKDDTLDLNPLIEPQETIKNQDLKAKVKQQVNLSNGTSYMVAKVERNYTSTSRYIKAKTGKELVKVDLVIGNKSKEDKLFLTTSMFKLKNSVGGKISAEYISKTDVADILTSQELEPGKQVKAALIFQVDKDEKISLTTEDKYKRLGSDETATVASEVTL